jgi:hypothetical protein
MKPWWPFLVGRLYYDEAFSVLLLVWDCSNNYGIILYVIDEYSLVGYDILRRPVLGRTESWLSRSSYKAFSKMDSYKMHLRVSWTDLWILTSLEGLSSEVEGEINVWE